MFAATAASGVFRSTDGGNTWAASNSGLTNLVVQSLAASSSGDLYAGTIGLNGGVFKLPAGSSTWQLVSGLPTDPAARTPAVSALAVNSSGDVFAALLSPQIYRLAAGSSSWQATGQINANRLFSLVISSSGRIWVSTDQGVLSSANNGGSWNTTGALPGVSTPIQSLAIDNSANVLYAGVRLSEFTRNGGGGIYRSTNGGSSWTSVGLQGQAVSAIALVGGQVFAGTTQATQAGGLYVSSNQGLTWTQVTAGLGGMTGVLAIAPTSNALFLGANGAFRSTDGGSSWQPVNQGLLAARQISAVMFVSNNDLYAGSLLHGVTHSTDLANWTQVDSGLSAFNIQQFLLNAAGQLIAGDHNSTAYVLSGGSWSPSNINILEGVESLTLNSSNQVIAGTQGFGGNVFFLSSNNGVTYNTVTEPAAGQAFALVTASDGTIYAGCEKNGVWFSTDGGNTWQNLGVPTGSAPANTLAVGFNPSRQLLVARANQGIYCYLGSGSWQNCSNGLSGATVRDIKLDPAGKNVYAASNFGVFASSDGRNWQPFNSGLSVPDSRTLTFDAAGTLYAGTKGGIFRTAAP